MAKSRRSAPSASSSKQQQTPPLDESNAAVARPNTRRRVKAPSPKVSPENALSLWFTIVSTWLPLLIITGFAYIAVSDGFTTAPEYVRSKSLMSLFKAAFVVLVCLGNRSQLAHVYTPPNKSKTLSLLAWGHIKALVVVILANCAGTTVIQPLFGDAPKYAATIELVIPVYIMTEVAIGLLSIPAAVIRFVVGFLVSWLKAATTSTLVLKWQQDEGAHPIAFVLICTCNLFASGFVLRYVAHYHASRRVLGVSFSLMWSLLKTMGVSAVVGLLAYVANHLSTRQERQLEATALYFAIAWYALDKYWKPSLRSALLHFLTAAPVKTKAD